MTEKKPVLLLTGATGFIGKHVVTYFVSLGWHVIGLARKIPGDPPENVSYLKYDLLSDESISIPEKVEKAILPNTKLYRDFACNLLYHIHQQSMEQESIHL